MKLVYKNETPLFTILLIVSVLVWVAVIAASKGVVLAAIPFAFLSYTFAQSAFIAHFQGRGALVSADQFPDLDSKVKAAVAALQMKKTPSTYLVNGNGVFNAFATKFLRRYYVVLNSSVVDALRDDPDSINFYIGHELGHIRRRHLLWHAALLPGLMLPLAGAAYLRACEYTCDLHGKAACADPNSAARGLGGPGRGQQEVEGARHRQLRGASRADAWLLDVFSRTACLISLADQTAVPGQFRLSGLSAATSTGCPTCSPPSYPGSVLRRRFSSTVRSW